MPTRRDSQTMSENKALHAAIVADESATLEAWLTEAGASDANSRRSMAVEAGDLLVLLRDALAAGADPASISGEAWGPVRQSLESLSRSRAARGQSVKVCMGQIVHGRSIGRMKALRYNVPDLRSVATHIMWTRLGNHLQPRSPACAHVKQGESNSFCFLSCALPVAILPRLMLDFGEPHERRP